MAHREHVITKKMDEILGDVLNNVNTIPEDETEEYQPLPIQGSWQLGYSAGSAGKPFYNIAKMREEVGMSQEELAEALGVPQSSVSRWESGKVQPRRDTLHEIISLLETAPRKSFSKDMVEETNSETEKAWLEGNP